MLASIVSSFKCCRSHLQRLFGVDSINGGEVGVYDNGSSYLPEQVFRPFPCSKRIFLSHSYVPVWTLPWTAACLLFHIPKKNFPTWVHTCLKHQTPSNRAWIGVNLRLQLSCLILILQKAPMSEASSRTTKTLLNRTIQLQNSEVVPSSLSHCSIASPTLPIVQ